MKRHPWEFSLLLLHSDNLVLKKKELRKWDYF